jgi:hypothetical protein
VALARNTDGIEHTTMNAVTSSAQTNSGMRLSDMPGARSLKIVTMRHTATPRPDVSVNETSCAQTSERLPMPNSGPASGT